MATSSITSIAALPPDPDPAAVAALAARRDRYIAAHTNLDAMWANRAIARDVDRARATIATARIALADLLRPPSTEPELVAAYIGDDTPPNPDMIRGDADRIAQRVITARRMMGDYATHTWATTTLAVRGTTRDGILRRAADPHYWSRRLQREHHRAYETAAIRRDPAAIRWCSDAAATAAARRERETARWAAGLEMMTVTPDGEEIAVPFGGLVDPARRARKQYAELLARAAGIAEIARRVGHTPMLVTITVPPEMHPMTSRKPARRPNPNYDGTTFAEAHRWIAQRWRTITRRLARRHIAAEWVRTVQPHTDGTPHWHIVIWVAPDHHTTVEAYAREAFCARAEDGEDRFQYGVDVRLITGGTDGAVAYISRTVAYIARNVPANTPDATEASRTTAWASTWRIRRYQTSHDHVSVWRMCRRRDLTIDDDGSGTRAQDAARRGDYAEFLDAATAAGLRPAYASAPNRYGETVLRLTGVHADGVIYTPTFTWRRRRRAGDAVIPKDQGAGTGTPVDPLAPGSAPATTPEQPRAPPVAASGTLRSGDRAHGSDRAAGEYRWWLQRGAARCTVPAAAADLRRASAAQGRRSPPTCSA